MALVRWQPNDIFDLRRDVNQLFDTFWSNGDNGESPRPAVWRPSVDISETKEDYVVTADLPGINREDLDVTVVNGRLTIRGTRKQESESTQGTVHRVERVQGTFTRSFDLPTAVAADRIEATYRDGVLTVSVPKAEEAKPRQIEVKVSA